MEPHTNQRIEPLTYISIFSGIEAASVAWEPLGFRPLAFAEVDPFPSAVLRARFPHVPNLGDVTTIDWSGFHGKTDIIVGGSPCQAFSIAGKREGLADERGKLMLEYVRAVREVQPAYCIWENVPGALSQDGGRAFATLLRELEECRYALAWRVLDAQFAGVAQRRRRVFLVGVSEDRFPKPGAAIQRAGEILFEPDCLRGDHPTSKQKREELARAARNSACSAGGRGSGSASSRLGSYALAANTIDRKPQNGGNGLGASEELCYTLTAMDRHAVSAVAEPGPLNPWDNQTSRVYHEGGIAPTILSNNAGGYKGGAVLDQGDAVYALKIRGGCEGGGKGALVQTDVSATLSTRQDQTIFQPTCIADGEASDGKSGGFIYHGSADTRSIGYEVEQSPTITAEGKPPAVAFAQNSRDEVRLVGGDGSLAGALCASSGAKQQTYITQYGKELAGTLTARHDSSPCADRGQNIVCLGDDNANASCDIDLSGALKVGGSAPIINDEKPEGGAAIPVNTMVATRGGKLGRGTGFGIGEDGEAGYTITANHPHAVAKASGRQGRPSMVVRRLTPTECERLQGFPDDWTLIEWKGRPAEECPDTPRYKAIGNSMAVPVMRWIGERLVTPHGTADETLSD